MSGCIRQDNLLGQVPSDQDKTEQKLEKILNLHSNIRFYYRRFCSFGFRYSDFGFSRRYHNIFMTRLKRLVKRQLSNLSPTISNPFPIGSFILHRASYNQKSPSHETTISFQTPLLECFLKYEQGF
mgnify:CR=1 FL=1